MLSKKHLLGLDGYPKRDIERIIKTGFKFREVLDRTIKKDSEVRTLNSTA